MRDAGVIVGMTTSGPQQAEAVRRALDVEVDGLPLFGCVQATWNLLEPSVGPALAAAAAAGRGVIVKEAVANGRLTPVGDAATVIGPIAAAHGTTVDALAIAAALAQPGVSVVLSGAASVAQLASNLTAIGVAVPELPNLAEPPEAYWATRSDRPWT